MVVELVLALTFVVLVGTIALRHERRALAKAPPGTTRIEVVKAAFVNSTIRRYTAAGWDLVDQSAAKSFGTQARVSLRFRKP